MYASPELSLTSLAETLLLKLRRRDDVSSGEEAVVIKLLDRAETVSARFDMVREGDRPTFSTLLIAGYAARYNFVSNGSRAITAVHVPGDFVDFHSFLLKDMDHGVVALTDCVIVKVPHQSLKTLSEQHPHLMRLFSLCSLIDAAVHRQWVVCLGRLRASAHLAHLVCELYQMLEAVELASNFHFDFPITQDDLADMLGLSSVHTNRVLQELRQLGLITWRGATMKINDWAKLSAYAEFDSRYLHLTPERR